MQRCIFKLRLIAAMVALVILGGCAGTPMTDRITASPPQGIPLSAELPDVPFFAQTQYHCGPATLATVLNATGLDTSPDSLAASVYTPGRQGTLKTEILSGSRRQGRLALPVRTISDAFQNITKGRAVLILQNLALEIVPQWHYAVMVGFDLPEQFVVLRSGTTRRQVMPMKTFEHTWRRSEFWGVVVVRPEGPVPENTSLAEWLNEAFAIERAGHKDAALTALDRAAEHWPDATAPLMAAANIYFDDDQLGKAVDSLQMAVNRQPDDPVALNNLAHVQMLQGKLEEAEANALKAIGYGGRTEKTARETLKAILARK